MRRSDAARRHRRSVVIVAALAGVIVVLFYAVVPWAEDLYEARGIEPSPGAVLLFQVSRVVVEHIVLVVLLVAALIGLLWTSYGLLERLAGPRS